MFGRLIEPVWRKKFTAPYIHIVFGARQTGKSTLLKHLLPEAALWLDLSDPEQRFTHLRDPGRFARLCRALPNTAPPALVVVDEAQHVPAVFDAVQHLYDLDH
ncbi:MAG: AAA family ATPase, partial [Acidobacteria bacterium]|nr:AAA family ATPase [Acidobacteriota bacterium]